MNKDGSGFTGLHGFPAATRDGVNPYAALLFASDGALYGNTLHGGEYNWGTVFKLFTSAPTIIITHIEWTASGIEIAASGGAANQTYQIQASSDLSRAAAWQTIGTSTADIDGNFTFEDHDASNYQSRFYRIKVQ